MENKVLFVAGASSDVGDALIRHIADNYDVILAHYHSSTAIIDGLRRGFGDKIVPLQADLSDNIQTQGLAHAVERYGVDHFIHLPATGATNIRFDKVSWEQFNETINISLHSAVMLSQACLKNMVKQKYGRILFMLTSAISSQPAPAFWSTYITVKSSLYGLMKALSSEYARKGITVNGVSPSMIETKFLTDIPELARQIQAEKSPLKRNLVPQDVISAFEFLLSSGADCVTGQNIAITAGS